MISFMSWAPSLPNSPVKLNESWMIWKIKALRGNPILLFKEELMTPGTRTITKFCQEKWKKSFWIQLKRWTTSIWHSISLPYKLSQLSSLCMSHKSECLQWEKMLLSQATIICSKKWKIVKRTRTKFLGPGALESTRTLSWTRLKKLLLTGLLN